MHRPLEIAFDKNKRYFYTLSLQFINFVICGCIHIINQNWEINFDVRIVIKIYLFIIWIDSTKENHTKAAWVGIYNESS